jgi:excinuclease ABC subunit C
MSETPSNPLAEQAAHLPTRPGVYLFRDAEETVLYVGKAKSLRSRVRSYFGSTTSHSLKTQELVRRIAFLETIVVGSEAEALILEENLIKEHRPRFNIHLRDDKRYPYIKVTVAEPFPRVFVTRQVKNDGSRYFGPYTVVGPLRQALEVIKRLYTVRSCTYDLPTDTPTRPCLDFHIGRCLAPCVGLQSEGSYRKMTNEILQILEGETEDIRQNVEVRMQEASQGLEYERAAQLRDVLRGLDSLARKQRVHRVGAGDQDVLGLARDGDLAVGIVLRIREGCLLGRDTLRYSRIKDEEDRSLLDTLAKRVYLGRGEEGLGDLPREILAPEDFDDRALLQAVLSQSAGRNVTLRVPQRGDKLRLVGLASENARHLLEDRVAAASFATDRADEALYDLQHRLELKVVPRLMVCFDVSHTQGADTVASAVAFENGTPRKSEYRHMRIKGEWGNDDYRSMEEVVTRFFRRRLDEDRPIPDLAVIDGGKGQLRAATEALTALSLPHISVAALAKRDEEVYLPGRRDPLRLSRRDRALHLLQRIRDEAHRFAVSYNRKLRRKRTIRSEIGEIPGIGPARQRALLSRFGSVKRIREASAEEIARVPGFSDTLATRILTYLGR